MKQILRLVSILGTLTLLTGLLFSPIGNVALAENSTEPITLRFSWWGSDNRNNATLAVIEQYKKIAPNVTIEAEYMGADGYPEKMKSQLTAGTAPDIIQSDAQWTDDLRRMGDFFANLEDFSDVLDTTGFDENFLNGFCRNGNVLNYLPTGINNLTFIFNTAVLDKSSIDVNQDWNWDLLLSEGKKVNATTPDEYFLCLGQTALHEVLRSYLRQITGNQIVLDDYTPGFTRDQLIQVLAYEKQLFDERILQPADVSFSFNLKTVMMDPDWVNGKFGGTIDLTSVLGGIIEPFKNTVDVARIPLLSGATEASQSIKPAQIIGINKASPYQEECAKFLNYFFNDREAILTLKDVRSIQPTKAGRDICIEAGVVNPHVAKAVNLASQCTTPTISENGPSRNAQVIVVFVSAVESVGYGTATPEQAADTMLKQLDVTLAQLKESN